MAHTGIVLKRITPYKIALLDKQLGRINAIVTRSSLCVGSLLHYVIEREQGFFMYIANYQIDDLPFALARNDILFWHHVLELCFYFVPVGSCTAQLFELCMFLYTVDTNACWSIQSKKLYLVRLLKAIGFYPRLPLLPPEILHHVFTIPLSALGSWTMDKQHEKRVDEWLRMCIGDHPAVGHFKTMHYLLFE